MIALLSENSRSDTRIHFLSAIKVLGGPKGLKVLESLKSDPMFGKEARALWGDADNAGPGGSMPVWMPAYCLGRTVMDPFRVEAFESMFIVDGGPEASLPPGSGGPILAGPEAIFIAGRIGFDAPTVVRVGADGGQGELLRVLVPVRKLVGVDGRSCGVAG
jgi:hypothetical protein